jgi:hypothetical protein
MDTNTKVTIRTATIGQSFGTIGQVISLDGEVLAETETKPYGFAGAALTAAETLAAKRGYTVVADAAD